MTDIEQLKDYITFDIEFIKNMIFGNNNIRANKIQIILSKI